MKALCFDVAHFLTIFTLVIDKEALVPLVLNYSFCCSKVVPSAALSRALDVQQNSLATHAVLAEMIMSELICKNEWTLFALELLLIHHVSNMNIYVLCSDESLVATTTFLFITRSYTLPAR